MNTEELLEKLKRIDWEFTESNTQYLTHNIHRYSGKFIPQIARTAIELLSKDGDIVLDPYMGSGTTLLESQLSNRYSIGIDLNPLAVLIAQGKNCILGELDFKYLTEDFIDNLDCMSVDNQLPLFFEGTNEQIKIFESESWRFNDSWFTKWFQPHILHDLIAIYSCVLSISLPKAKLIAKVTFSDILRKFSNANSRYPNVMFDKNAPKKASPYKFYKQLLLKNLSDLRDLRTQVTPAFVPTIYCCSNLNMPIEDASVNAIITHPPYIAAIPYAEYGALSLHWFGINEKELDKKLTGGKRQSKSVVSRFFVDYSLFFKECYRVLKPGCFLFVMVGNPTSAGKTIDLKTESIKCATNAGFFPFFTSTRNGINRRGNKMGNEYLLFFYKE